MGKTNVEYADEQVTVYPSPCPFKCRYCWSSQPIWVYRTRNANPLMEAMRLINFKEPKKVVISFTTDPYQPKESVEHLTRRTVQTLATMTRHQIMVLTKSPLVEEDFELFSEWQGEYEANIWIGTTLTSVIGIPWHEPLASPNPVRIKILENAHSIGLDTWASIEPWIPRVTYPEQIVEATKDFVDWYVIGKLNYPKRFGYVIPKGFYKQELPLVLDFFKKSGVKFLIKKELLKEIEEN